MKGPLNAPRPLVLLALASLALGGLGCDQSGNSTPPLPLAGLGGVPTMLPGSDCLRCHRPGGTAASHVWTVAGTVFPTATACPLDGGPGCGTGVEGVEVLVTDVNGRSFTLTTNAAGNFYTDQPLATLQTVMIQNGTHRMNMDVSIVGGGQALLAMSTSGQAPTADGGVSCNACHALGSFPPTPGLLGAPGNLFIPQD